MLLYLLRCLFVLLMAAAGYYYLNRSPKEFTWAALPIALLLALVILFIDVISSRRKLLALAGVLFGLLLGLAIAFALGYVVQWQVDLYMKGADPQIRDSLNGFFQLLLTFVCCYLTISFVMQTKDDVRFIIPYVEFAKQTKGARPLLLDTSVLIDGRISDLAQIGLIDSRLVIPRFVLEELQTLADCSDRVKRNRGRRGLDVIGKLQANRKVDVVIFEHPAEEEGAREVDQRLVALATEMEGRLVTTDLNLHKVAQLRGVEVINLTELAAALKPVVMAGERLELLLVKPGEQSGQGVGYLDDGTMVVVEGGKEYVGREPVEAMVTNIIQSASGRMVFARIEPGSPVQGAALEMSAQAETPTSAGRRGQRRAVRSEPKS